MKNCVALKWTLIVIALITWTGCEQQKAGVAAPLNDISTLEKLAESYKQAAEQIPSNPANLAPKMRRKFVEQVFTNAGFGYRETLVSLSRVPSVNITQLHRDMQELLFLPHHLLAKEALSQIYSEEEIALINQITLNFH